MNISLNAFSCFCLYSYSDSSAAASFYSSGWPYRYYASSSPCWRTYYAGSKAVRVAVMDVSLYRRSYSYCYTTDPHFDIRGKRVLTLYILVLAKSLSSNWIFVSFSSTKVYFASVQTIPESYCRLLFSYQIWLLFKLR